jgi:hypothetical protein
MTGSTTITPVRGDGFKHRANAMNVSQIYDADDEHRSPGPFGRALELFEMEDFSGVITLFLLILLIPFFVSLFGTKTFASLALSLIAWPWHHCGHLCATPEA